MKENKFFGRTAYLDILHKRITGLIDGYHQNIAMLGDETVGKTSIIFKLLNSFCDNRVVIIYVESRPEPLNSFAGRFIGVLLFNFLLNSGITLKEDLDFLIAKSEKFIPRTTEKIRQILNSLNRRKKENVFTELFSLCDSLYNETGKSCIVIIDEFHNLETMGVKNLYKEWAKLLILQKNTMYIITSSMKFKAKQILSKNLSLLFGNFEILYVEPFDIRTCEEYLNRKLKDTCPHAGIKNFIVNFTGGYPLYLEIITDSIIKNPSLALSEILENLLFDASGILNQRFSNYIKRFLDSSYGNDYLSIAYLISTGSNTIKEIGRLLKKQRKELMQRINHLMELDTITRNGDFLKINDRVLAFWLRFVYQEKMNSLTFDARSQKMLFAEEIEKMIQEFLSQAKKPLVERLAEILRMFEDESLQMGKKKVRLSHFREIKHLEFSGSQLKDGLIGRSSDSLWIMGLKPGLLTEEDVVDFSKECRKYRHKLQRKIIVTLQDIDSNTRLRAMEEKIWAWDINNLNQLFDLFSKPGVIA